MASEIPLPSTLAWSWVIEALSRSNQVDTSLLIDIIKKAPDVSDDELGKNCREVVSLRILESLIVKGSQNKNKDAATVGQKLELDPSNNCEDVLRQISEMSAMDLTAVAPEMLNGDVQSFIGHKRASLPKPALQKLKDAILEGSHSILASLKERSGLTVTTQHNDDILVDGTTQHNDDILVDGGNSNVLAQRLEDCSINHKVTLPYGNAGSPTRDNMDDESQENLSDTNLLPAKRKTAAMRSEIMEIQTDGDQITLDDCCTSHVQATKKFKQKANFTEDTVIENAIAPTRHGPLTTLSERVVSYIENEGCNLKKEVQGGSPTPQNVDNDLEGNFPESNLLPAKRNRTTIAAENSEGKTLRDQIPLGDGCDIRRKVVKEFKQDGNSIMDNIDEDSVASPVHGLMKFSSEGTVKLKHVEKEGCNLETEVQVGGVESNGSPHDDDDQHYGLKRIARSSHAFHQDHLVCDLQVPDDDAKVAELHAELDGQNNGVDETDGHDQDFELQTANATSLAMGVREKNNSPENPMQNSEGNFQQSFGGSGSKDDMQHNPDFDMTSDSDDYRDERMDIALKKDAFLSSQCTYSQDSFATQAKYCVKCNKEGQLLVCSSDTCQLAVHSSCLPSAANFDGNGKFFCPFCAYSCAISEYMQVKRKASFARKDLASFIGVKTVCQQKKATMKLGRESQNQLQKNDELCVNDEGNNGEDIVNKVSDSHCGVKMGNKHQAEPPLSCSSDHSHSGEKVVSPSDGLPSTLVSGNLERKDMEQQCQSLRVQVEQPVVAHPVHGSDVDCKEAHMADRNEGNAGAEGKKVSEIPESALPQEPVCGPISESSEEDNEKSARSYSIRLRRPIKDYTYPAIPQLRRKILPWTKAEEEKLKEGVQRLSGPHDRSIPWKQILEFGGDVFQRGRTTIDLKDKWRNICKGGPR